MSLLRIKHSSVSGSPLSGDLDHILTHTDGLWEGLRGKRIFITGGTGFIGTWILESFAWANDNLDLKASALVLTRDVKKFNQYAPHLAEYPSILFQEGDIRNFTFPVGEFSHIIHAAATSAVETFNNEDPLAKFDTVVLGTRRALDFAVQCRARKFLLTSSGAVYGKQPPDVQHVSEEYSGAPDTGDPRSAWGEGKRVAEYLCTYYSSQYGISTKIARCFSFVGPYLPLDVHYAIGNFIRDSIQGGPIQVKSDGTAYRSYLYAADLAIWLWTILLKDTSSDIYNVGSEDAISIGDLARAVARCSGHPVEIRIASAPDPNRVPDLYVPSTMRARMILGVRQYLDLATALERTIAYARLPTSSGA